VWRFYFSSPEDLLRIFLVMVAFRRRHHSCRPRHSHCRDNAVWPCRAQWLPLVVSLLVMAAKADGSCPPGTTGSGESTANMRGGTSYITMTSINPQAPKPLHLNPVSGAEMCMRVQNSTPHTHRGTHTHTQTHTHEQHRTRCTWHVH